MKYSELHRIITRNGWQKIRQTGSHVIYEKGGITIPVPFHGAKEIPEGLRKSIVKQMELK